MVPSGNKELLQERHFFVCCKNTVSVEVNAKPMGMQLKYSLHSTEFCRSYKNKYGQKASSCTHLSQPCWLVVQPPGSFPLGRAGKDPGKAFLKGDVCSCLALECPRMKKLLRKGGPLLSLRVKTSSPLKSAEIVLQPSSPSTCSGNLTLPRVIFPI